jgi:hypothetical protein
LFKLNRRYIDIYGSSIFKLNNKSQKITKQIVERRNKWKRNWLNYFFIHRYSFHAIKKKLLPIKKTNKLFSIVHLLKKHKTKFIFYSLYRIIINLFKLNKLLFTSTYWAFKVIVSYVYFLEKKIDMKSFNHLKPFFDTKRIFFHVAEKVYNNILPFQISDKLKYLKSAMNSNKFRYKFRLNNNNIFSFNWEVPSKKYKTKKKSFIDKNFIAFRKAEDQRQNRFFFKKSKKKKIPWFFVLELKQDVLIKNSNWLQNMYFIRTLIKKGGFLINSYQYNMLEKNLHFGDILMPVNFLKYLIYKSMLNILESNLWFLFVDEVSKKSQKHLINVSKSRFNSIINLPNFIEVNYNLITLVVLKYNIKRLTPSFNKTLNLFFKRRRIL